MLARLNKFKHSLRRNKIKAFLITSNSNIRYLTAFEASDSWLLVTEKKTFYITDARYKEEVAKSLRGVEVVCWSASMGETVFQLLRKLRMRTLGFDERHLTVWQYRALQRACPQAIRCRPCNGLVEELREIKSPEEIKYIQKALGIHQRCLKYIKKYIKYGASEWEIFLKIDQFIKKEKGLFSFDPIVASGPNSSYPHAHITDRRFRRKDLVLLDMGVDYRGYKSDLTRMFFLGKIPTLIQEIHDAVNESQRLAIKHIYDGAVISEVDAQARNYLKKLKLDKYFGHGLGHGVGLDIHESPGLNPRNQNKLKAGMVVTIEPAVYLPQQFGIRLEEMVLVTQKGCKVLSARSY